MDKYSCVKLIIIAYFSITEAIWLWDLFGNGYFYIASCEITRPEMGNIIGCLNYYDNVVIYVDIWINCTDDVSAWHVIQSFSS